MFFKKNHGKIFKKTRQKNSNQIIFKKLLRNNKEKIVTSNTL